jgi:hypothetical protein
LSRSGLKISEETYYRWRNKHGGLEISEARRLKELQTENDRLKKLVPDQALDIQILKEVNAKNGNTTHQKLVDLSGAHFW